MVLGQIICAFYGSTSIGITASILYFVQLFSSLDLEIF